MASSALEEPDAVGGPVGSEGVADDPAGGHGAPESAVVGLATVVPHHEPVSGRNLDGGREVALLDAAAGPDVAVLLAFAVAVDVPFPDGERVPGAGDDALDEVDGALVRVGLVAGRAAIVDGGARVRAALRVFGVDGRVEDRDLADVRFAEVHADAVDEHALADRERRFHRAARDAVGLDDERLDADREQHRDRDDRDELHDRAGRRFRAFALAAAAGLRWPRARFPAALLDRAARALLAGGPRGLSAGAFAGARAGAPRRGRAPLPGVRRRAVLGAP